MFRCDILITSAIVACGVGATTITATVGIAAVAAAVAVAGSVLAPAALPPAHAAAGDPGTLAFKFGSAGQSYPDQFSDIEHFAVAPNGSILVYNKVHVLSGRDSVKVFYPNGAYSHEIFGAVLKGDVVFGPNGEVWSYHEYNRLNLYGEVNLTLPKYVYPRSITPDGNFAHVYGDGIGVFYPNGTLAFKFGSRGTYDGEFSNRISTVVAPNGNIYAYDEILRRLQVFDPNGTLAFKIEPFNMDGVNRYHYGFSVGPSGEILVEYGHDFFDLYYPNGTLVGRLTGDRFVFGPSGTIVGVGSHIGDRPKTIVVYTGLNSTNEWVLPPAPHRPHLPPPAMVSPSAPGPRGVITPPPVPLSLAGADFSSKFGSYGSGPGQFLGPYDVAFGPGGIIAVSDFGNHRIQVFHPNGTFAFEFGSYGSADGQFAGPYGLAFGPDSQLAVFDFGNHRVQIFRIR